MTARASTRYSRANALLFERLYGEGYQGPSDRRLFDGLCDLMEVDRSDVVLDAGCGLGGDAFRLGAARGAAVIGADVSADLVRVCQERQAKAADLDLVRFVESDVTKPVLPPGSATVVWSRDCLFLLTGPQKTEALAAFHGQLTPGGRLLLTDYTAGHRPTAAFLTRMGEWDHHLWDDATYARAVAAAGFVDIHVQDRTADLERCMLAGRDDLLRHRDRWCRELGSEQWQRLLDRWERKVQSCSSGEIRWTLVRAARAPDGEVNRG